MPCITSRSTSVGYGNAFASLKQFELATKEDNEDLDYKIKLKSIQSRFVMNEILKQPLLVIEDSDEDFTALKRTLNKVRVSHPVYRCEDGEDALDFLYRQGEYENEATSPRPALIVLDLNLPGTDGREVLATVKEDRDLQTIPVIIFSTSSNPIDIEACYRHGVSGYIVKPMNSAQLQKLVEIFTQYWFKAVELPSIQQ